ncbi:hypothetical protein BHU72_05350 [Desulfuribacillus stibiiarsenatis]|uniref:Uncharacterized protein n=1 Tax=Desulfuribacillus stibiiarsenatis TaxID=1390249 RepID=A0A1E5L5S2_9FIRM|nr:hypothetical protein BHU72_05350 [Desulfuribacillus stibiiarsenatis]
MNIQIDVLKSRKRQLLLIIILIGFIILLALSIFFMNIGQLLVVDDSYEQADHCCIDGQFIGPYIICYRFVP